MKLEVIIEKADKGLFARIENKEFQPVTYGKNTSEIISNLVDLIADYLKHEKRLNKFWGKVNPKTLSFDLTYDLQSFFVEHEYINISAIAERAGLNKALVRQYASGVKHPSIRQAKKIETTIHKLAKELQAVSLYAEE